MLRSTAVVPTSRAPRYRDQLASHGAGMLRHGPRRDHAEGPPIQDATVTGQSVVLDLTWGRCTITATDEALVLTAEAPTAEDLGRIQAGVGQRVTKIGRRDDLQVAWSPPAGEPAVATTAAPRRRHGVLRSPVAIAMVVLLALAVHLGLAAALLRQQWAWWVLLGVGAVVLVKVVALGHVAMSRIHGDPSAAPPRR